MHSVEVEIERNYVAFVDMLHRLLPEGSGKYALMHGQKLQGIFETPGTAAVQGFSRFGKAGYSIQLITDEPVDLGFMSNAIRQK